MEEAPAIDSPGVRSTLRRDRLRAWAVLLGGLLLFVGFVIGATVVADRTEDLERRGVRTEGSVVSYSRGTRLSSEHVDVEFTFGGSSRTERAQLDGSSPQYRPGEQVTVLLDPENPD